ncbi:hypothetical protein NDU88_004118 [Pleurodeles waltl]|uniref:Uncharacterized protein n=1 Tax=Pleurodeles waltl TaxID=8319 RepID=A0AAV7MSR6_PLEWA|nr:hypothetical protein NDU88_004118 [Pleurodeles waltl]
MGHSSSSGYGTAPPAQWIITPQVDLGVPRGVASTSGTRLKEPEGGCEVPKMAAGGRGVAQVSWVEGMDLNYNEDSPEAGELVEVDSAMDDDRRDVWEQGVPNGSRSNIL